MKQKEIDKIMEVYQWLTGERPVYHEIKEKFGIPLAQAQELDNICLQASGPGGHGFRWFCKKFKRIIKS